MPTRDVAPYWNCPAKPKLCRVLESTSYYSSRCRIFLKCAMWFAALPGTKLSFLSRASTAMHAERSRRMKAASNRMVGAVPLSDFFKQIQCGKHIAESPLATLLSPQKSHKPLAPADASKYDLLPQSEDNIACLCFAAAKLTASSD